MLPINPLCMVVNPEGRGHIFSLWLKSHCRNEGISGVPPTPRPPPPGGSNAGEGGGARRWERTTLLKFSREKEAERVAPPHGSKEDGGLEASWCPVSIPVALS